MVEVRMWLLLLAVPEADACSCAAAGMSPPEYARVPRYGAVDVPVNVVVRTVWLTEAPMNVGRAVVGGVESSFTLTEGDDPVPSTSLVFDEDLPENTLVELFLVDATRPFLTFTTGAWRDTRAPSWTGGHRVSSDRRQMGTCGGLYAHQIELDGVDDDAPPADLLAFGVPREAGLPPIVGSGAGLATSYNETCGGDATLAEHFHRSYDLHLFDAAGNAAEPAVASTGCATAPSGGFGGAWAGSALIAALVSRRRATAARRRPAAR